MSFPEGPEYESYVALCRELRLEREIVRGDYVVWHEGGDPMLWTADQSPSSGIWIWEPRLDQLLAMLEEAGVFRTVAFTTMADGTYRCTALERVGELRGSRTREEAALRLWMAVTGREVRT